MRQLLPEYPPVTLAQMSEQMRQVFRKKALVAVFISRKRRYVKNIKFASTVPSISAKRRAVSVLCACHTGQICQTTVRRRLADADVRTSI